MKNKKSLLLSKCTRKRQKHQQIITTQCGSWYQRGMHTVRSSMRHTKRSSRREKGGLSAKTGMRSSGPPTRKVDKARTCLNLSHLERTRGVCVCVCVCACVCVVGAGVDESRRVCFSCCKLGVRESWLKGNM
jgi:hypothetical protein